jgi:hypothetical protein
VLDHIALADVVSLSEIAPLVGSYFSAFNMAAGGKFGPVIAKVGRSKLYSRAAAEAALAERDAKRKSTKPAA